MWYAMVSLAIGGVVAACIVARRRVGLTLDERKRSALDAANRS